MSSPKPGAYVGPIGAEAVPGDASAVNESSFCRAASLRGIHFCAATIFTIGDESSDVRACSDYMRKYVFDPAVEPKGYEVERADQIAVPGMISVQIVQKLLDADLVIADLTGYNPNVFYELAVRHAFHKPVIQVIDKGQRIPFDLSDHRTIHTSLQVYDVERAVGEIQQQVDQIEKGNLGETPIRIAATMQKIGDDPQGRLLSQVLDALSGIQSQLDQLKRSSWVPSLGQQTYGKILDLAVQGSVFSPSADSVFRDALSAAHSVGGLALIKDPPQK